jgi:tripartite ATP-independent transporter DctM subunit
MDVFILIGSFTIVCLMGMPVAYALAIASILAALWVGIPLEAVMLKVSGGISGFSLLAIPFFILAGAIMAVGGMAERLVNLAKVFVGFIRGGMALVNILASTMFGCISGSSVADTAAVGSVMIPQMIKNGYPRLFAVNVTISGSLQPPLVPPSHNMIIYSIAAGGTISVAHLFMAGIILHKLACAHELSLPRSRTSRPRPDRAREQGGFAPDLMHCQGAWQRLRAHRCRPGATREHVPLAPPLRPSTAP